MIMLIRNSEKFNNIYTKTWLWLFLSCLLCSRNSIRIFNCVLISGNRKMLFAPQNYSPISNHPTSSKMFIICLSNPMLPMHFSVRLNLTSKWQKVSISHDQFPQILIMVHFSYTFLSSLSAQNLWERPFFSFLIVWRLRCCIVTELRNQTHSCKQLDIR